MMLFLPNLAYCQSDLQSLDSNAQPTVLCVHLNGKLVDHYEAEPLLVSLFSSKKEEHAQDIDLPALKSVIKKAASDPHIQGIYLEVGKHFAGGWASLQNLRSALADFQKSNKPVFIYAPELYTISKYYLVSVANKIIVAPTTDLILLGLKIEGYYFRSLLNKLDIEPIVFKSGKYKSYTESITEHKISGPDKNQKQEILDTVIDTFFADIARSRNMDTAYIHQHVKTKPIISAMSALQYNFIDCIAYKNEIPNIISKTLLADENKTQTSIVHQPKYKRWQEYYQQVKPTLPIHTNQIAVLVVKGSLHNNTKLSDGTTSREFTKALKKVRENKAIKAVVLVINSPGGDSTVADEMYHAVQLTSKVKPVIAYMSDISASGGYYLASACDKIVANPLTITGSIGVFMYPILNLKEFLQKHLYIHHDVVKTHPSADMLENFMHRDLTKAEKAQLQAFTEEIYDRFIKKVAQHTKLSESEVKELAQGRVYIGSKAKALRLVDEIGNVEEAIHAAAIQAKLQDNQYTVRYVKVKEHTAWWRAGFLQQLQAHIAHQVVQDIMNQYPYLQTQQSPTHMHLDLDVQG